MSDRYVSYDAVEKAVRDLAEKLRARARRYRDDPDLSDHAGMIDSCADQVDVMAFGLYVLPSITLKPTP